MSLSFHRFVFTSYSFHSDSVTCFASRQCTKISERHDDTGIACGAWPRKYATRTINERRRECVSASEGVVDTRIRWFSSSDLRRRRRVAMSLCRNQFTQYQCILHAVIHTVPVQFLSGEEDAPSNVAVYLLLFLCIMTTISVLYASLSSSLSTQFSAIDVSSSHSSPSSSSSLSSTSESFNDSSFETNASLSSVS